MGQMESVPFSALIAGMLLYDRNLNSTSIVNMMSKFEDKNVHVDDDTDNDNLDKLRYCVDISSYYDFSLKAGLDYDTVLYGDVTVYKFLVMNTNSVVLSLLGINCFDFEEVDTVDKNLKDNKYDFGFSGLKELISSLIIKKSSSKVLAKRKKIVI